MDDYSISDRIPAEQRLPMERPWDRHIKDIRSVIIRKGVTHIGSYAFWGMCAKCVQIPDGVKSIGYSAFCLSDASADIYIPDGVETISCVAFPGCITSIRVPVFSDHLSYVSICSIPALEKIYFAGTNEEWDSLWIKEYICSRKIEVYYNCE